MRVQAVRWKVARRHLNRPRHNRIRWVIAAGFALLLLASGAGTAAGMYFVSQLPPASGFRVHFAFQDARIYDSRGDLLYNMADLGRHGGRRIVEPLQARGDHGNPCRGGVNRVPLVLQNATIATEDATFYQNPGFDTLSILRAAYQNFRYGHIVSGASTITQQLVRANMLSDQRTLNRKAQEIALAYEITKRYSKRRILWYYLNSVPYGNLAYGAQAAARVYFGVPVCRLDLAQAALLAGLPRAPSLYNPILHRRVALARMRTVLGLMHQHGYLRSRSLIRTAEAEAARWTFSTPNPGMRYPQFVQYVIDQLQRMPRLRAHLYRGIDVYTTLDPRLQDMAQRTVTQQIDGLSQQHVTNGALISLDLRPQRYGWILAMVGSAHYGQHAGQINMTNSPRQPGSSMKPFNYIWALTHGGVYPGTSVIDSPIRLPDPNDPEDGGWYQPIDYDHQFHGTVTLRQALANSLNVPAVKVEYYVTHPDRVAATAHTFGMTHLYHDNPGIGCRVCYAVTLGGLTRGTRPIEETAAYGVFATGGWTVPPVAIWKVVRRSTRQVLFCSALCPPRVKPAAWLVAQRLHVLDAAHAYIMTDILSDNSARCTIQVCEFGLNSQLLLSRSAAAKTGTTNSWTDNWTVGYVPQMVTGVWVGNDDRSAMVNVSGITGAAPIWHDYMENAFKILRLPVVPFVQPANLIRSGLCSAPGGRYWQTGSVDLQVPSPGRTYPMCSLPDRGFMPAACPPGTSIQFPGYQSVPPAVSQSCTYTGTSLYTYGNGYSPAPYGNGTTYQPVAPAVPAPPVAQPPVAQPPPVTRPAPPPVQPAPPPAAAPTRPPDVLAPSGKSAAPVPTPPPP